MTKILARCLACGQRFRLDAAFAGTALPCPTCGARDGLAVGDTASPTTARGQTATGPAAKTAPETTQKVPVNPRSTATLTESSAAPVARSEAAEVVCPRCHLHFVPRRGAAEAARSAQRTVLVVEDRDYFRELAQEALGTDFELRFATNTAEAREQLAHGDVDLMVLDPSLDGADHGITLLRELRTKPCAIIIYTEQDESEIYGSSWEALQRLGADDMVRKGMNAGEILRRKVGQLLGEELDEGE